MEIVYLADCPQHTGTVASWLFSEWGRHNSGTSLERVETLLSGLSFDVAKQRRG